MNLDDVDFTVRAANEIPLEMTLSRIENLIQEWKSNPKDKYICEIAHLSMMINIKHQIGHTGVEATIKRIKEAKSTLDMFGNMAHRKN